MGTLILALAIFAGILYGLYQLPEIKKQVTRWGDGGCYGRNGLWDEDTRIWLIVLSIIGFFALWLTVFCFARSGLVEKYQKWETKTEIMSYDYNGQKPDQFILARDGSYYYVMVEEGEGFAQKHYSISSTTIKTSNAKPPHLEEEFKYKKVKKSERPFMFFKKKDVKSKSGCGCSNRMLYVPTTFTFKDID